MKFEMTFQQGYPQSLLIMKIFDSASLKFLIKLVEELGNSKVEELEVVESKFTNLPKIKEFKLSSRPHKSFMQDIQITKENYLDWSATPSDWLENKEKLESLLVSNQGHQYFGDSVTKIILTISYNEQEP